MKEYKWERKLRFWLHDDSPDWVGDHLAYPVMKLICVFRGHEVIDDQCDKPEHRYCVRCNVATPNQKVTV